MRLTLNVDSINLCKCSSRSQWNGWQKREQQLKLSFYSTIPTETISWHANQCNVGYPLEKVKCWYVCIFDYAVYLYNLFHAHPNTVRFGRISHRFYRRTIHFELPILFFFFVSSAFSNQIGSHPNPQLIIVNEFISYNRIINWEDPANCVIVLLDRNDISSNSCKPLDIQCGMRNVDCG